MQKFIAALFIGLQYLFNSLFKKSICYISFKDRTKIVILDFTKIEFLTPNLFKRTSTSCHKSVSRRDLTYRPSLPSCVNLTKSNLIYLKKITSYI